MEGKPSDEQMESMIRSLVESSYADEATINDVADSRATWWGVQRRINQEKDTHATPWPPPPKWWRLFAAVPAIAAAVLAVAFVVVQRDPPPPEVALFSQVMMTMTEAPAVDTTVAEPGRAATEPTVERVKQRIVKKTPGPKPVKTRPRTEIKTDFIALSYAQDPETGQLVRMKVPSSMMVSLGLVPTVPNPSSLVTAEVIVGDDGLTHAIRFIR